MLIDLGLQRKAPNIVVAPQPAVDRDAILGLIPSQYDGLKQVRDTDYYYGNNRMYEPYTITSSPSYYGGYYGAGKGGGSNRAEGTLEVGDQAFRPVDVDVTGFSKTKGDNDIYSYDPSMAYVLSQTPKPKPVQTPNVTSFLSSPTANTYVGSYGTDRFTQGNGLLGFDFGLPSGKSANE
jgi:hypothetical protein